MDFSSLPTDNLYKFIALAGIALLVVSIAYPLGKMEDLTIRMAELKGQVGVLAVRRQHLTDDVERLKKNKSSIANAMVLLQKGRELEIAVAEQEAKLIEIESAVARLEDYKRYFSLGAGAGAFLAVIGFLLWYTQVQRYQDRRLRIGSEPPHEP